MVSRGVASAAPVVSQPSRSPRPSTKSRGDPSASVEANPSDPNRFGEGGRAKAPAKRTGKSRAGKRSADLRGHGFPITVGKCAPRGVGRREDATGEPSGEPEHRPATSGLSKESGGRRRAAEVLGTDVRVGDPHVPSSALLHRSPRASRPAPVGRTHARSGSRHGDVVSEGLPAEGGGVVSSSGGERAGSLSQSEAVSPLLRKGSVKPRSLLQSEAVSPLLHKAEVFAPRARADQVPPTKGEPAGTTKIHVKIEG